MDLGIAGRRAILLASSRGLGRACAESLAREGVHVIVNGRTAADVDAAVAGVTAVVVAVRSLGNNPGACATDQAPSRRKKFSGEMRYFE